MKHLVNQLIWVVFVMILPFGIGMTVPAQLIERRVSLTVSVIVAVLLSVFSSAVPFLLRR